NLQLDAQFGGNLLGYQGVGAKQLSATLSARRKMLSPNEKQSCPFYEGLTCNLQAQVSGVAYHDIGLAELRAEVTSDGRQVELRSLGANQANNHLQAHGNFRLPAPGEEILKQPAEIEFNWVAPEIGEYWLSDAPGKTTGEGQANGAIKVRNGIVSGAITGFGQGITAQKLGVSQISLQSTTAQNRISLN